MIYRKCLHSIFLGGVLLAGCARPSDLPQKAPAVKPGELPQITVIAGGAESYWNEAKRGAQAAGKKFGAKIVWEVPSGKDLIKSQKDLVEDAINDSHGVVLAPLDSTKLMQPVGDAARSGLAVVVFNRDVFTIQNKLSFVHNDDYQTGVLAAQQVGKVNASQANVAVIAASLRPEIQERIRGFEDQTQKKVANLTVTQAKGLTFSTNTSVGFCLDEDQVDDVIPNPKLKTKIVCFGAGEKLAQELKRGEIAALITPDFYEMAYQSVKAIMDYRALKMPPREIKIAPRVLTNQAIKGVLDERNHASRRFTRRSRSAR